MMTYQNSLRKGPVFRNLLICHRCLGDWGIEGKEDSHRHANDEGNADTLHTAQDLAGPASGFDQASEACEE